MPKLEITFKHDYGADVWFVRKGAPLRRAFVKIQAFERSEQKDRIFYFCEDQMGERKQFVAEEKELFCVGKEPHEVLMAIQISQNLV